MGKSTNLRRICRGKSVANPTPKFINTRGPRFLSSQQDLSFSFSLSPKRVLVLTLTSALLTIAPSALHPHSSPSPSALHPLSPSFSSSSTIAPLTTLSLSLLTLYTALTLTLRTLSALTLTLSLRAVLSFAVTKLTAANHFDDIRKFLDELFQTRPDLNNERFISHAIVLYGHANMLPHALRTFNHMREELAPPPR